MNTADQRKGARKFVQTWAGKGYEKGETQAFWLSLLKDVFGVKNPETLLVFEQPVFNRGVVPARLLNKRAPIMRSTKRKSSPTAPCSRRFSKASATQTI